MSHQMVGIVINRLVTDEDLRVRFALDPIETLADLNFRGYELTPEEVDVFMRTDTRTWFLSDALLCDRRH
jgi:hypothetical protein